MDDSMAVHKPQLPPARLAAALFLGALAVGLGLYGMMWKDGRGLGMFMPHGACYMWRADLIGGHVASDLLIGLSYVSISLTLWYLVRRAKGAIPFHWVFVAFGVFIVACGATHFMEILTLWRPMFWTSMGVKIVTAVASVATAIVLPPLVPQVLGLVASARVSEERGVALQHASDELEERIKQEQLLRREAQSANAKKDEFLANMSHELRTPLNSIIGFSELMHNGLAGPVSETHQEYLRDIVGSSRHLLRLINDILDLAKVESGTMEVQPERVAVSGVIEEVCALLASLTAAKRLEITTWIDPGIAVVSVDVGRFKQILFNYLSNAIKFTPEGGRIQVRVGPAGPDLFRVDVEDSGIGIAAHDLDRLFVEFQQLDTGAGKDFQGTGLGLALSRRLAHILGGEVSVRSTPGKGSTFSVVLPREGRAVAAAGPAPPGADAAAAPATPSMSAALAPASGHDPRPVLLVNDDPMALKYAAVVLAGAGYRSVPAETAAEALRVLIKERVRAVVVDHFLPDQEGVEFVEQLRHDAEMATVPILSWTAHDPTAEEERRLRALGVTHVPKRTGDVGRLLEELKRVAPPAGG